MVVTGRIRTSLWGKSRLLVKRLGRRTLVRGGRGVEGLASSGICEKFHFLELALTVVSFVAEEANAVVGGIREPMETKFDLLQIFLALRPVLICF